MRKRNHYIFLHTLLFLLIFPLYAASPLLCRCGHKDFFADTGASANPVQAKDMTLKDDKKIVPGFLLKEGASIYELNAGRRHLSKEEI